MIESHHQTTCIRCSRGETVDWVDGTPLHAGVFRCTDPRDHTGGRLT